MDVQTVCKVIDDIIGEVIVFCCWRFHEAWAMKRSIVFFFGYPFKVLARVFLRTAKEESIFVDAFFFDFTYDTLESMTAFGFSHRFHISPNPKRARFGLVRAYEEWSSIACFHGIYDNTHFYRFIMFFTAWLCLFCAFPGGHSLLV